MKRLIPLLTVLALLAAGCGGDKKDVKSAKSAGSTSSSVSADTTATTAASGGATATTTATAKGKTATTAAGRSATTASGASTGKVPVPAAPGTYDYAQSGTSSTGAVPANGTLKVDAAGPNGVQLLHRYVDPAQPPSDTTVAYRSDGPFITDTVVRQQQLEIKCHFDPAVPAPPWPATDGKPIAGKANCGSTSVDVKGTITGHRTTKLDGADIDVVVATVTITTHGQVESTNTETQWWSPALRLTVHTESHTKGTFSGTFPFESNVTTDLKSGKPHS
ncbi:MAG: hypothetical protein H0W70_03760 [Actinobacteria bacterium]|nr:hypothetical protein [Actinomycetota bacterium]